MELLRQIAPQDLPALQELLSTVFHDSHYSNIARLGGMTNRSYVVTRPDGEKYVLRLPGEGTQELINRMDEEKSTKLACQLKIDAPCLFFSANDGCKVSHYIDSSFPMNEQLMQQSSNLKKAAQLLRRLHNCGQNTTVPFEVFSMAANYEAIILKATVPLYDDYPIVKGRVMAIKQELDRIAPAPKVPCHNDLVIGNWVLSSKGRLYLVDWEYAGMNTAMWDVACLSLETAYDDAHDDELLTSYLERKPNKIDIKQFIAHKIFIDYLWTLWGLTRVPFDGQFMRDYAQMRYTRLKKNLANT